MKPLLYSLLLLAAGSAHAEAMNLTPGQSYTVPTQNSESVTVSCVAQPPATSTNPPSNPSQGFCVCRVNSVGSSVEVELLKVTTTAAGERSAVKLKLFDTQKACDKAIRSYPPCL